MPPLRIPRRFRGPPDSGNGGYVAGCIARELGGSDVLVTLRSPPPLDVDLDLERGRGEISIAHHGETIASAVHTPIELAVPEPPGFEAAAAAEARFAGHRHHIFPGCFVCGPDRSAGDGLRIFAGRIDPAVAPVASTWVPDVSLADGEGRCRIEYLWAALDCPGYFAVQERCGMALLGRLGARVVRRPSVGEPLIITGWPIGSEGRKHQAGTAIHSAEGEPIAAAVATWVSLKAVATPPAPS